MANTQYRKNLLDIAQASKNYTDKVAQEILWKIGEYDITTQTDNTSALVKTAPSGATRVKIKRISGNCVKYAPSTASDDSVAQIKVIPENSYTTELNTLGSMSYKCFNLCPNATYNGIMNNTIARSVDLGNLAQGTYTISFNVLANADNRTFILYYVNNGVVDNVNNINTGLKGTGAKSFTFTLDDSVTYDDIRLSINTGTVSFSIELNNLMLNAGSTALPYQPYFDGIRDSAVTNFIVSGNLLDIADVEERTTSTGLTYKVQNGKLILNTTSLSSTTTLFLTLKTPITIDPSSRYSSLSGVNTAKSMQWYLTSNGATSSNTYRSANAFIRNGHTVENVYLSNAAGNNTYSQVYIFINYDATFDNTIYTPMLVKGSTAPTVYKPYIAPITKTIPQEIQALEGYGWGINDTCYNYIDLNRKVFVQKADRYVCDNNTEITQQFADSGNGIGVRVFVPNIVKPTYAINTVLSNLKSYSQITYDSYYSNNSVGYAVHNTSSTTATIIYMRLGAGYDTIEKVKNYLIDNNAIFYYELNTPIETDISSLLPTDFNKILTNDNYTNIEFVSEYGYDIPNKISFYGTIKETLCTAINKNDTLAVSLTNNEAKYGWSAGSVANVRDYTTNKSSQKVDKLVLNGSENWSIEGSASGILFRYINSTYTGSNSEVSADSDKLAGVSANYNWSNNIENQISVNNAGYIHIRVNSDITTVTELTSWLANNNIICYIKLATEVVEDITPLDNNVIEVVENDDLEFVNSENQAVPSEITYRIEVEK